MVVGCSVKGIVGGVACVVGNETAVGGIGDDLAEIKRKAMAVCHKRQAPSQQRQEKGGEARCLTALSCRSKLLAPAC